MTAKETFSGFSLIHARKIRKHVHDSRAARSIRCRAMWLRFVDLMTAQCEPFRRDAETDVARRNVMRSARVRGLPRRWLYRSGLEAADLGEVDRFEPADAQEAVSHLQGSAGKVEAMEARAAAGENLYHPEDGVECYEQ